MVKVAVIGCGTMGAKIACELALHGHHVAIHDSNPGKLNLAKQTIENDRLQLIKDGLPKFILKKGSILYLDNLKFAVQNSDIIFESVVEDLNVKRTIFREIKTHCPLRSIICSGTISLNLDSIVENVENPERTLGVRFLFPVLCIPEVELVKNSFSSQDVVSYVSRFLCDMGKLVISRNCEPFNLSEKEAALRKAKFIEKFRSGQILTNSKAGDISSQESSPSTSPSLSFSSSKFPGNSNVLLDNLESSVSPPFTRECAICMDAERDTLLCPCRHLLTCSSCSWSLIANQEACPICRAPIKEILHVFHS